MRSRSRRLIACSLGVCVGALGFSASAHALTPTITEYSSGLLTGASPQSIVAGPDGRLWFTDQGARAIGRIDPATHAIDEFKSGLASGAVPSEITAGPDGALWFTDNGTTKALGRATTAGAITEFTPPGTTPTDGLAAGSDGNIWFISEASPQSIARITLPGEQLDTFSSGLNPNPVALALAAGPDGNLWFTDEGTPQAIGRVVPATGAITEFPLPPGHDPQFIAGGPDGNVWAADFRQIERITPDGSITSFSAGLNANSAPEGVAAGPDGAVWFTDRGATRAIGRITPSGQITEFPLSAGADPFEIARGADGAMWFTDEGSTPAIGRITTPPAASTVSAMATGQTTANVVASANGNSEAATFHIEYGPLGAATTSTPEQSVGPANTPESLVVPLGGLQPATPYEARIVATNPTGTTDGAFVTFTTAAPPAPPPRVSRLHLSPRTFVAAKRGPTILAAARRKPGTIVSYKDSSKATTTFTVFRVEAGRRAGRRCVKPTRRTRHAKHCTRLVRFGRSFKHVDQVGPNRFRFSGRVSRRRLPPGSYRLAAQPSEGPLRGSVVRTRFRVKAR